MFYSSIDLVSAYNQIILSPESRQYTAFVSSRGKVPMVQGTIRFGKFRADILCKLLAAALDLEPSLFPYVSVYVDDLILYTPTLELHMEMLEKMFSRFSKS